MPTSRRSVVAGLCALSGLAVIFAMGAGLTLRDLDIILSAGCGAMIGGVICAGLFGHSGRLGIALSALGAVLATSIGAALAGAVFGLLVGPTLAGIVYGPMMVGYAIITNPVVLLAWVATMAAAHIVSARMANRAFLPS
jgi:hypothetical protein